MACLVLAGEAVGGISDVGDMIRLARCNILRTGAWKGGGVGLFTLVSMTKTELVHFPLSISLDTSVTAIFGSRRARFFQNVSAVVPFSNECAPRRNRLLRVRSFTSISNLLTTITGPLSISRCSPGARDLSLMQTVFAKVRMNNMPRILIRVFRHHELVTHTKLVLFFTGGRFRGVDRSKLSLSAGLLTMLRNAGLGFRDFRFTGHMFSLSRCFQRTAGRRIAAFTNRRGLTIRSMRIFLTTTNPRVEGGVSLVQRSTILRGCDASRVITITTDVRFPLTLSSSKHVVIPSGGARLEGLLHFLSRSCCRSPLSGAEFVSGSGHGIS